jgi:arginyl-tRNA synthetase
LYFYLQTRLGQRMAEFLLEKYNLSWAVFRVEQPPRIELGEYAFPLAFELARNLRQPPRKIAEEIVRGIGPIEGIERLEVAGAGYINAYVDRAAFAAMVASNVLPSSTPGEPKIPKKSGKILVEHSSINPNKAAHIGHLRNAILGDTFVRLLRFAGREVDVQNYIDNTGVQVADVVVGFLYIQKRSRTEIEQLTQQPRFDYYCWDLYARTSQWYEQSPDNKKVRLQTLHEIEQGGNETAAIAELISVAVLRRHLETMDRLDIEYDFLPRESEILRLHFWDAAFGKLKESGVLSFESEGKNKGCWVMRRAGTSKLLAAEGTENTEENTKKDINELLTTIGISGLSDGSGGISEEDQKVIVRSNGTVGYVGKDIAYHMWKFGLLGKDFGYQKFYLYPNRHQCWISAEQGEAEHPHFGDVAEIYNVIDARQAEAQNTVIEALRGLGHGKAADHYTHFSYEMVALTPRCAAELGYELSEEDKARPYVEVSGRRGFGVKADDLLDALIASAKQEVDSRHPELDEAERQKIAEQIAIGALRYFMLKYTKPSVIAFDFKEALSFEGETGPYAQYAVVRATNIFRKGGIDPDQFSVEDVDFTRFLMFPVEERPLQGRVAHAPSSDAALKGLLFHGNAHDSGGNDKNANGSEKNSQGNGKTSTGGDEGSHGSNNDSANELWELWLAASKTAYVVDQCIATTEPAYLAKHVFQLAQMFNTFYHRYPILIEEDEERKKFLLATAAVVRRELIRALAVLGIEVPSVM